MKIIGIEPDSMELYETIPIVLTVKSIYEVEPIKQGLKGIRLNEVSLDQPYVKDYDLHESPADWSKQFDVSNWKFFLAMDGELPVGGTAVAYDTPGVNMLGGRTDLSVLWDIRVHPEYRGFGIGTALFRRAEEWSLGKKCSWMKVETQNINVPACKFYAKMGCVLGEINTQAYVKDGLGHETMLVWYLRI